MNLLNGQLLLDYLEEAENYNGQQGDMWDAHKDMLLATIGAIFYGLLALMLPSKTNNS